jgi:4,5-dihydroxyphthalate decarboxylase
MELQIALGDYPHTDAVRNGSYAMHSAELVFEEIVRPMPTYFRQMVRDGAFDVCEMGVTTYLAAREYDAPLTALPIVTSFTFPFRNVVVNSAAGVTEPKDLERKRIGCRTHTVTTVVWARGLLGDMFGVDFADSTWVINDFEHTQEFRWPPNVELHEGVDLSAMIESGDLAAGIGVYRGSDASVEPLFDDIATLEQRCVEEVGLYPVSHVLVVRDEMIARSPETIAELYNLFVAAKEEFLPLLDTPDRLDPASETLARRRRYLDDPLPYGIEENRTTLDALLRYCKVQGVFTRDTDLEDLFYQP